MSAANSARAPSATPLPFESVAFTVRTIFSPGSYESLSKVRVTVLAVDFVTSTVVVAVTVDAAAVEALPNVITEVPAATPVSENVATPEVVAADARTVAVAAVPSNA